MYFYQYHPFSRYKKQSHYKRKKSYTPQWGTEECKFASVDNSISTFTFLLVLLILRTKLALCRT